MPKARDAGRRGRGHAEPAVVVDVPGAAAPTRANLPSAYAFSLVRPPPPKTATASGPCVVLDARGCRRRPGRARRPSSPGAARRAASRTSGVVSRSGWSSSSAAVQPFWHSPPRLVGKSRRCDASPPAVVARAASSRTAGRSTGSASPLPGASAPVELPTVHRLSCRESVPPGGFRSGSLLFRSCQVGLTPHRGSGCDGWVTALASAGRSTSVAVADFIPRGAVSASRRGVVGG